jgi:FkbH-like protein
MISQYNPGAFREKDRPIKCVVWDLDNTIWEGVLSENDLLRLRPQIVEIIHTLDSRGILQSIASKNEHDLAMEKLDEFHLREYFLFPQINWNSKVSSIRAIAEALNIGLDSVAFIDDHPYELSEVSFSLPQLICVNASSVQSLLDMPEMNSQFITEDSRMRRLRYLADVERKKREQEFVGPKEEFLATLNMTLSLRTAEEEDLKRAEELTVRTNQLNTTGYTYSYQELNQFRLSEDHKLLIIGLEDIFGDYGKVGLALLQRRLDVWTIKLFLMSCRVMSTGVGMVALNWIMRLAKKHQARLRAEFVPNGRNRMMYIAYKFAGFEDKERRGDLIVLEHDLMIIQPLPAYININALDDDRY